MTQEQKQIRDWMIAFGQETPEKPVVPSLEIRKLRAKLILEEALETIEKGLGMKVYWKDNWHEGKLEPAYEFRGYGNPNLTEIADGCEDLKVVTEGTLVACGLVDTQQFKPSKDGMNMTVIHKDPLYNEVMRSNWTKFWTEDELELHSEENQTFTKVTDGYRKYLVKDKDGKVIKSPSYSPANLVPIIEEMAKI